MIYRLINRYNSPMWRRFAATLLLLIIPVLTAISIIYGTIEGLWDGAREYYRDLKELFTVYVPRFYRDAIKVIRTGEPI